MKLNLGCSDQFIEGFIGVDSWTPAWATPETFQKVDLRRDWPWPDNSVDHVRAWDIIEHLPLPIVTMNELHRILKPGGTVEIVVPTTEGRGAWQDPTHVSFWNRNSFFYFTAGDPHYTRFHEAYGIKGAFRVKAERQDAIADGVVKLAIALEAVKAGTRCDESAKGALGRLLSKMISPTLASIFLLTVCGAALQANPTPGRRDDVGILRGEGVPILAGYRVTQGASLDISDVSNWVKVVRIDAMPHAAKMIQFQAIGHRANCNFIGDDVRLLHARAVVTLAISIRVEMAGPQPACVGFMDLAPELLWYESMRNKRAAGRGHSDFGQDSFSDSRGQCFIRHGATRVPRPFGNALDFAKRLNRLDRLALAQQHGYYFTASGAAA